MDILSELYNKSVTENERNLRFWDSYLQNLKSLDFNAYNEKLKVPVLVPIGSRILFRGELKHTNEVTVALGADYFVKCSLKQADIIKQHRIKGAQEKVDAYIKEKEYLQNQMSFTKQSIYDDQGQEIIENCTEEEDNAWRKKHKQNVRKYMQNKAKEKENERQEDQITDEELWNKLEELELQEEILNEYGIDDDTEKRKEQPVFIKQEDNLNILLSSDNDREIKDIDKAKKEIKNKEVTVAANNTSSSTYNLLQQVLNKQHELDGKLHELKTRERSQTKTEEDLIARLDELEQLDELEDEMERLDDIIQTEDIEESEEEEVELIKPTASNLKKRVSFVDEDESVTLHLTFKHSDTEPNREPYDATKGIQKPSDVYTAYPNLFGCKTSSILKKSKYAPDNDVPIIKPLNVNLSKNTTDVTEVNPPKFNVNEEKQNKQSIIIIDDIVENVGQDQKKLPTETKPISLFKKKRMENKQSM